MKASQNWIGLLSMLWLLQLFVPVTVDAVEHGPHFFLALPSHHHHHHRPWHLPFGWNRPSVFSWHVATKDDDLFVVIPATTTTTTTFSVFSTTNTTTFSTLWHLRGGSVGGIVGTLLRTALQNPLLLMLLAADTACEVYKDHIPYPKLVHAMVQTLGVAYMFFLLVQFQQMQAHAANES